jgi:hypothetical protein
LGRDDFSGEDLATEAALLLVQAISNAAALCRHTSSIQTPLGFAQYSNHRQ